MLPRLLIGVGMRVMAFGPLLRSRLAWAIALLLASTAAVSMLFGQHAHGHLLLSDFALISALLAFAWRQFDRTSVAAGTLLALTAVTMRVVYVTFGAFYVGDGFQPKVTDLVTALYYAIVAMSTVGTGRADADRRTDQCRLRDEAAGSARSRHGRRAAYGCVTRFRPGHPAWNEGSTNLQPGPSSCGAGIARMQAPDTTIIRTAASGA